MVAVAREEENVIGAIQGRKAKNSSKTYQTRQHDEIASSLNDSYIDADCPIFRIEGADMSLQHYVLFPKKALGQHLV